METMKKSEFNYKLPVITNVIYNIHKECNKQEFKGMPIKSSTSINMLSDNEALVCLQVDIFEKENNEYPFYLSITIEGMFSWNQELSEELVNNLLKQNAPSLLLSFLRPYVTTLTVSSGFGPIILPLINLTSDEN